MAPQRIRHRPSTPKRGGPTEARACTRHIFIWDLMGTRMSNTPALWSGCWRYAARNQRGSHTEVPALSQLCCCTTILRQRSMHRLAFRGSSCCRATGRKGGSDTAVRGRRTGRRSNVAVEGEAGLNTAQLASGQAPQRLKGTCKQRLPANQRAEASCRQQCKRLRIQGKMRASPRLCTLAQPVTCQLTSKTALCKALADVPSLAAAKSAAHLMSCGAYDDSRDIKFSSMGPKDKSRRVAGNVPDGNPLDVLPFSSSSSRYHSWRGKGTTLSEFAARTHSRHD